MDRQLRDVTEGCRIRIDKEGKWFYEGCAIINPLVLRAFCEALETDEHGRHRIIIGDELCYIEVEDTPFVISAIRGDPAIGLYVRLNTLETFPLDPTKLCIGDDNILYAILPEWHEGPFYTACILQPGAPHGTGRNRHYRVKD